MSDWPEMVYGFRPDPGAEADFTENLGPPDFAPGASYETLHFISLSKVREHLHQAAKVYESRDEPISAAVARDLAASFPDQPIETEEER